VVRNLTECGAFLKVFSPLAFLTRLNFGLNRIQSAVAGWFGEKPPKSALSSPDQLGPPLSSFSPRATMTITSSASGRCSWSASSGGAVIQISISSAVVRIAGIAFG
jgi:hypothetical protein